MVLLGLAMHYARSAQPGRAPAGTLRQRDWPAAEKLDEYKKLHAAVWPKVVAAVREANIRNYSIYLRKLPDGKYYLFSYMEYVGDDYQGDMQRLAANPEIKRWWTLTDPCQEPLPDRKSGEWWASMEEVCHQD